MPYKDKNKKREYLREYYQAHKKEKIKRDQKYRRGHKEERNKNNRKHENHKIAAHIAFVDKFHTACQDCGTVEDLCFHHVDPNTKLYSVSQMYRKSHALVKQEIAKCISMCRSCHSKLHLKWRRGNSNR